MMKSFRNRKGFSLVELLVVIVILGILVALALPRYINATKSAQIETCRANIRAINSAISAYQAKKKGTLPTSLADLTTEGFFDDTPTCPFGVAYALNTDKDAVDTTSHFDGTWQTAAEHK